MERMSAADYLAEQRRLMGGKAPAAPARPSGKKAGNKYKAVAVKADGVRFDSKKELRRYRELQLLQSAGRIEDLQHQVEFVLIPKQTKPSGGTEAGVKYVADFVYTEGGVRVVEDVKSEVTRKHPAYVIKRKLMLLRHGIEVAEV